MNGFAKTGRRSAKQLGFTLIELMVSLGIVGTLGGFVATTTFVTIRTDAVSAGKVDVSTEITKSTRWLVRDIHRALTSDVVDGAPAVSSGSFTWNISGVPNTCTYDIDGGTSTLRRTCPGSTISVANGVSGLSITRSGDVITLAYTITSTVNSAMTEDIQLNVLLGGS